MRRSVINFNNVWKQYKIGTSKKLTETISSLFSKEKQKEFWALKNVCLEINEGEIVGIIGPNGSGKSTLLKILAGITYPTKGSVNINGKVSSLLELGTGFHPELTGRENIYLYGTILGIKKSQINKNFSNIVTFSGIGKFLDTPVKHYSSGMYLRLAFSVATHLEFDILLIDEVLGVGDANFQQKSLEKIKELIKEDKTVVIVSHDLGVINRLCHRAVLFKGGKIIKVGVSERVIDYYLKNS